MIFNLNEYNDVWTNIYFLSVLFKSLEGTMRGGIIQLPGDVSMLNRTREKFSILLVVSH
jgi:hypothetical protein